MLEAAKIGLLKRLHDAFVNGLLKLLFGHRLQLSDLCVHFVEVFGSKLRIAHHLLHSLGENLLAPLLGQLGSQMFTSTLHGEATVTDVDTLLLQSLFHLSVKLGTDLVLNR